MKERRGGRGDGATRREHPLISKSRLIFPSFVPKSEQIEKSCMRTHHWPLSLIFFSWRTNALISFKNGLFHPGVLSRWTGFISGPTINDHQRRFSVCERLHASLWSSSFLFICPAVWSVWPRCLSGQGFCLVKVFVRSRCLSDYLSCYMYSRLLCLVQVSVWSRCLSDYL